MTTAAPFSNVVTSMRTCGTGHPSNYQGVSKTLNTNADVEARIQAAIARDGIRLKEFFIDFDKLRKGVVGEAAVSIFCNLNRLNRRFDVFSSGLALALSTLVFSQQRSMALLRSISLRMEPSL